MYLIHYFTGNRRGILKCSYWSVPTYEFLLECSTQNFSDRKLPTENCLQKIAYRKLHIENCKGKIAEFMFSLECCVWVCLLWSYWCFILDNFCFSLSRPPRNFSLWLNNTGITTVCLITLALFRFKNSYIKLQLANFLKICSYIKLH